MPSTTLMVLPSTLPNVPVAPFCILTSPFKFIDGDVIVVPVEDIRFIEDLEVAL